MPLLQLFLACVVLKLPAIKGTLDDIKDTNLAFIFVGKSFYLILELSIYYKGLLHKSLSDVHHLLHCPLGASRILECFCQGAGVTDIPATRGYNVSIIHTWPALIHRGCTNAWLFRRFKTEAKHPLGRPKEFLVFWDRSSLLC